MHYNTSIGKIEIEFVQTDAAVVALANTLQSKTVIGFDTEFDRFWREYGFKLFLLQIFDGEKCYLVDPLACKNLQPLWAIFENPTICKVAYACAEDVQILKINNCTPVNIFDMQVAAKLCNHAANSFSDLIGAEFNAIADKTYQRSNWRKRPLLDAQMIYASIDVIWLIELHKKFTTIAKEKGVYEMLQEENKICENIEASDYVVKISSKQIAKFNPVQQAALLSLFNVRNEIAATYNMPPANIVNDTLLEDIVEDKNIFYNFGFEKGFCRNLQEDEKNKNKFVVAIENMENCKPHYIERKERVREEIFFADKDKRKIEVERNCKQINEVLSDQYGSITGEYILRGIKKNLLAKPFAAIEVRDYQRKVIDEICEDLNIIL
jgi:ribonuclease D